MGVKVLATRGGLLAIRVIRGWRKWIGTTLTDTPANRARLERIAGLIAADLDEGKKLRASLRRWLGYEPTGILPDDDMASVPRPAPTVREYFDAWIETQVPPRVRAETGRERRWYFKAAILPVIGELRLSAVTHAHLAELRDVMLKRGPKGKPLTSRSVRKVMTGLQSFWSDARKVSRLVEHDPFLGLTYPDTVEELPEPFTEAERDAILKATRAAFPEHYPFVYFQFWTGCRPSETCALRIGGLNLAAGRASILRSRPRGEEGAPKTRASRRTIDLLPGVVKVLAGVRRGLARGPDAYVFLDSRGRPLRPDTWQKGYWSRILDVAGADVRRLRFYATRHTFISVALSHGLDAKLIAEQCGTSLAMIERHYGRYILRDRFARLAKIEAKATEPEGGESTTESETLAGSESEPREVPRDAGTSLHFHHRREDESGAPESDRLTPRSFYARISAAPNPLDRLWGRNRDEVGAKSETDFTFLRDGTAHADLIRAALPAPARPA